MCCVCFFLSTYFEYFSQLVFVLVARFCARFLNVHNSREELNLDRQICIQSEREYEWAKKEELVCAIFNDPN